MKATALLLVLAATGCHVEMDPGPVQTASQSVDGGSVELVRAEINLTAGELEIAGGGSKLVDADFRYSEKLGKPEVRYDATGFRGRLTVESPRRITGGEIKNEWKLRFGDKYPLDFDIRMGAGEGRLNFASLPVRKVEAQVGAGELDVDLRGNYTRDVEVDLKGGVGEARIRLPKNVGVVADVKGGIGSIEARGLIKRGDRYYNEAFQESKPAVRLTVRGGVGEIKLIAE